MYDVRAEIISLFKKTEILTKLMGKLLGNATGMEVFWTANLRKSEAKLPSYLTKKFWKRQTGKSDAGLAAIV